MSLRSFVPVSLAEGAKHNRWIVSQDTARHYDNTDLQKVKGVREKGEKLKVPDRDFFKPPLDTKSVLG